MFVLWILVACCMILLYGYAEWKLSRAVIKSIYKQETITFRGKKNYYVYARFLNAFIGVSSIYFGLTNFIRAEVVPGCWLAPALSVGLLVTYSTSQRIKFLRFESESDDAL